jgi:hypothetical protein
VLLGLVRDVEPKWNEIPLPHGKLEPKKKKKNSCPP